MASRGGERRFEVVLARRAIADLAAIHAWVAQGGQALADAWLARLEADIRLLAIFPERCPAAPEAGTLKLDLRHLLVGRYRVIFMVDGSTVHVLHVRHGARDRARRKDLR